MRKDTFFFKYSYLLFYWQRFVTAIHLLCTFVGTIIKVYKFKACSYCRTVLVSFMAEQLYHARTLIAQKLRDNLTAFRLSRKVLLVEFFLKLEKQTAYE